MAKPSTTPLEKQKISNKFLELSVNFFSGFIIMNTHNQVVDNIDDVNFYFRVF